jgi:opacity protein-like surface antigen
MKKSLIAAAFVSTALVASAAQAQAVGEVGANFQHSVLNAGGPANPSADSYQLEGASRYDLGQVGVSFDAQLTDLDAKVTDRVDFAFTGHLNTRIGGDTLVGGFAGADLMEQGQKVWGVGLEGQTKLTAQDNLYGQAGYGQDKDLGDAKLWAGRLELRHFFTDNFKLQGEARYAHADTDFGHADAWTVGAEGEYRFAGTPWSIRGGYDFSRSDKLATDVHAFRVGARYSFGAATLKARDDAGADMGTLRDLFGSVILLGNGF